jgi:cell division protein FtsQ
MDGRGRLAQSLSAAAFSAGSFAGVRRRSWRRRGSVRFSSPAGQHVNRFTAAFSARVEAISAKVGRYALPKGVGTAVSAAIVCGSLGYGVVRGDHVDDVVAVFRNVRDAAANAVGFRIAAIALGGNKHLTREEILSIAGVTGTQSMLFLDVAETRARLLANPWIGEATVQKLYPGDLMIHVVEREPFALWQKGGRVGVIAADGTVLEPYVAQPLANLPMFVGDGAEARAHDLLQLLDRYPAFRDQVRAAVLVAERRWNLRMKSGMDIRLPEEDPAAAIDRLMALDHDRQILSRDLAFIDLRLPDRVTVRLTDAAQQARDETGKDKSKKKGGSA